MARNDSDTLDTIDVSESVSAADDADATGSHGDYGERNAQGGLSQLNNKSGNSFSSYGSKISGAVNNTRSVLKRHNTLTNNTLAQVYNKGKGPYSPNIDPNYTPNIFDKYAAENFQHAKNVAASDFISDTNRATALNAIGGIYSQPASEGIVSKAASPTRAALGLAAGALMSKAGDVVNGAVGQQSRGFLSKEGKAMYDGAYDTYSNVKGAHRDDWEDRARGFAAGVADAITNPIGAFSTLNSIYSDNKALSDTASDFKDVAEFQSYIDGRKNGSYSSLGDDSKDDSKGILKAMHSRAIHSNESPRNQRLVNAVPALTNFWKNVYIK